MTTLTLLSLAALLGDAAPGGAPMPSSSGQAWPRVPLNGPLRYEVRGNCMAQIPANLPSKLTVRRNKRRVQGRWIREKVQSGVPDKHARYKFVPRRPLTPGDYFVRAMVRFRGGLSLPPGQAARVQVLATRDTTPPKFTGLKGLYCQTPNPLLGCRPYGLFSVHGQAKDASRVRYRFYIRPRGGNYDLTRPLETTSLSYTTIPAVKHARGRYLLTVRAVDAADNEGGRVCEVALRLPLRKCRDYRRFRPRRGRWGRSATVRARCARWNRRRGRYISRIDRKVLPFRTR